MYPPPHYTDNTPAFTAGVMREHSFAVLTTADTAGAISATHLPLIFKDGDGEHGMLYGHIAKNNPQADAITQRRPATAIFSGPHAYISASLYDNPQKSVPTWDYIAVHAQGTLEPLPREHYFVEMDILVRAYEPTDGWQISTAPDYAKALMNGIVFFKLPIANIRGIRKMSQNKTPSERKRICNHLRKQIEPNAAFATADAITQTLT